MPPLARTAGGRHLRDLRRASETVAVYQPSLLGKLVEPATSLDQLRRRVEFRHPALVQHDDPIGVDDRVDAVRNRDNGAILEDTAAQGALEQRVRLDVNRGLDCAVSASFKTTEQRR